MRINFKGAIPAAIVALIIAMPGFGQYYSNDITPPGSASGKLNGTGGGKQVGGGSNQHAMLMSGNALSSIDLHPAAGYYTSMAMATDGVEECGYAASNLGGFRAMKWAGTSSSAMEMAMLSGFNFAYCVGIDNGQQVGFSEQQSYAVVASHAMLWTGGASVADLNPAGAFFSRAMGIKSGEQVGYTSSLAYPIGDTLGYHTTSHAIRWAGTAASAVDLHPAGFDASEALATNGVQQGGWAYSAADLNSHLHAMIWTGTAASAVDLQPAGFQDTKIVAMTDTLEVGDGWVGTPGVAGSVRHALVWHGTAASVEDLNQYLPAGYTHAVATGVDASGNVVGYAYNTYVQGMGIGPDAIAVVFAKGAASASALSSITLSTPNVAPGATVTATATLAGPAPAGGVNLIFLSTNTTLAPTPASVTIPEGATSATVSIAVGGTTLTMPTLVKLYASDGTISKTTTLTVTPVVKFTTLNINAVEGGFATTGTLVFNIPTQAGGAAVTLTSGDTSLLQVPVTITVPQGLTAFGFQATTTAVTALTTVPVTATFNGTTLTANVALSPAPVVAISTVVAPGVVGGQALFGAVNLNNFVRDAAGATITLASSDPATVQVPATVFVPQGQWVANFTAATAVVPGNKGVTIKATYNGSQASATTTIAPIPTVVITSATYNPTTQILKVTATTSYANSVLTYGANGVPFGTMVLELGLLQGAIVTATPPATITVWNSNGGEASAPVVLSASGGGGGGGGGSATGGGGSATGGGGGGGSTSTNFKLTVTRSGKGTVTCAKGTACAATYAPGSVVTLTATPDAGQPWIGWSGACTGTATTCTLTITKDTAVTANFK